MKQKLKIWPIIMAVQCSKVFLHNLAISYLLIGNTSYKKVTVEIIIIIVHTLVSVHSILMEIQLISL